MQRSHRLPPILLPLLVVAWLFPSFVAGQSSSPGDISGASNRYDIQLRALERLMAGTTAPEAAVLVQRAYALRDYLDDRDALTHWLAGIAQDPRQHPLVRDNAELRLASIDGHEGRLAQAESRHAALGFVRAWSVLGPLPSPGGLDTPAQPDDGCGPEPACAGRAGHARQWKQIPEPGPRPWVDLLDFFPHASAAVAFAATSLYSEQARQVALRFSSDSAFVLFVNGHEIFKRNKTSAVAFDQHSVSVELHPGWNNILFKFYRGSEDAWRFGLRVTELRGGGVALRASAETELVRDTHADNRPSGVDAAPAPEDLVALARATANSKSSAEEWDTLARLERERGMGTPLDSMQRAAALDPAAERWLFIAQMSKRESERVDALKRAVNADPRLEAARIEFADYYLHRGQLEKTRDLLKAASPRDFICRKRLGDLYARAGLNSRAASIYRELEQQFPKPLWLMRALAERWEDFGLLDHALALAQVALQSDFDGAEERSLLENIAERQQDAAALKSLYQQRLQVSPSDTTTMSKLAKLESGSGNFAEGEAMIRRALALAPQEAELYRASAEILASAGRTPEFQHELEQAAAFDRGSEDLRRRLGGKVAPEDPEKDYLVDAAAVAAAARQTAAPESADAVLLANIRVQRVQENGLESLRIQQITYVTGEEGSRRRSAQTVQYAPASEGLRILHARIYKPDGRVVDGEQAGDRAVSDPGVAMYYDVRARTVRFPGVEKGDVIELDYRIAPLAYSNPYGDYFGELVAFRSELEQRLQRYVLITPASRTFHIHEERMPAATVATGNGERVYRWEARDVPAAVSEPRGPALTEVAPYVHVSTFGSWKELGRWYAKLIGPQFNLDGALGEALAHVLAGQTTESDRIRAIYRFVVHNTHYVALEFGVYSYMPYPVSETYARRFGDCKDKASLMIALLRAAGVQADIALVRTRRLGAVGETPASISVFNHAVVHVPKYNLWLDGTAEYAGARELPLDDQGAMALTIAADGSSELRHIPMSNAADNYTRRAVRAQVGSDGVIRFTGTATARGEDAPGLRRDFEVKERQRDSFRERLAEVFPTVRVEDVAVRGANDLDRDVTVDFRGALDTFAGHKSVPLAASWLPRGYVEKLAPLATRSQELLLPAPWTTEEELRFFLPPGTTVPALPTDSRLETAFASAAVHYEQQSGELIVRTQVQFRKTRISPEQYPEFRAFCAELEHVFRREVKVVLP